MASNLTVLGTLTNNGTIKIGRDASLTVKTGTAGTLTAPNANYSAANTVSGEYTTYAFAVDTAKSEASLITDGGQPVLYGTFAEAVAAAGNDSRANTVVLNKDLTYTANVTPPTSPDSLDLNGHTMTITNAYLDAGYKVVTIQDSSQAKTGKITGGKSGNGLVSLRYSGSLNLISGTIEDTSGTAAIITNGRSLSEISIGAAATVTSTGYGILIDTSAPNNTSSNTIVHAYGTISATYGAIYVNGNVKDNGKDPLPVINVYEGARLSGTSGAGIYAAGQATWNISGGTTTGATGIYIKSGTLNVTGGSIVGKGEKAAPVYNGNGFNTTGDAIVADSCGYPGGVPSVNISGGALSSTNASAILSCMTQGTTPAIVSITGGYFTSDPSAYVVSGKIAQTTTKTGYNFEVVNKTTDAQFSAIPTGGSTTDKYTLSFETNGGSAVKAVTAEKNAVIDLTKYAPTKEGYDFSGWYSDSKLTTAVTSVTMTKDITVYAKWTEKSQTAKLPFTDVPETAYYRDAVAWAVEKGVTSGVTATTFAPDRVCTRAETVTFLWRAMGSPEPAAANNPFTDVSANDYYYKAVLWAVEKGITKGASDTTFSPAAPVTRAQTVTFLWRAAGMLAQSGSNPFTDVQTGAFYTDAVLWAVSKGITEGTGTTTFSPNLGCTRAQIVTFLYLYLAK